MEGILNKWRDKRGRCPMNSGSELDMPAGCRRLEGKRPRPAWAVSAVVFGQQIVHGGLEAVAAVDLQIDIAPAIVEIGLDETDAARL